jgi:hypothetical protein
MCVNAFAVALGVEESADADLRVDLLGRDFQLQLGRVAAIAFAGDVLRVSSGERKIIFRRRNSGGARGKGKSDAADKWMDGFHYDLPTFSTSNLHQDCKRSPGRREAARGWGLVKANVCQLLDCRLRNNGFNVLNRGRVVYFPIRGWQKDFQRQFSELPKTAEV